MKLPTHVLQEIIKALEERDKEGLKNMFSSVALEEANNIDAGIEYIIEFYQGNIISKKHSLVGSNSKNYGENASQLECFYRVTTDVDKYIVFFINQLEDTKNPENVGLYMLQMIKLSDREKEFDWGEKRQSVPVFIVHLLKNTNEGIVTEEICIYNR